jgi:two-component system sensor histidine kinase TctE
MPDTRSSPATPAAVLQPRLRANVRSAAARLLGRNAERRDGAADRRRAADLAPSVAPSSLNPLRNEGEQRSLFGEILDWMFAPVLVLWPISVMVTYLVAQSIAGTPFDAELADRAEFLADHLVLADGRVGFDAPSATRDVLRSEGPGSVYFSVTDEDGEVLGGNGALPAPAEDETPAIGRPQLRSAAINEREIRIASVRSRVGAGAAGRTVLVQVGETLERRSRLANEMIKGVIVPQFVGLPLGVMLVWFGLSRGLAPLRSLQARVHARTPDDLSPIDPKVVPEEIVPLVQSFNDLLERQGHNLQTQSRFIADAAHQLKTPLAGLRTQAELALREAEVPGVRRSLEQIAAATERATRLVNQLLALARAEHQASAPAAFELLDLDPLARGVVQDWVPMALERGIDLGYERVAGDARVIGLAPMLREALGNLIDNALRYTSRGGTVTVRVHAAAERVALDIEDNGPGIPESERTLVFERFYRRLGTDQDGSGLGLAIVREIVDQHDALLRIDFNPRASGGGPGTLISIEFSHTAGAAPMVAIG